MSRISALAHLQEIDQQSDTLAKRAHQIAEQLAGDPAVASARAALATEEKQLDSLRATLRALEADARGLDAKLGNTESELYSGRIQNPKELDGMEKERQMLKRRRSDLDDQLLELMDAVEQAQARTQTRRASLQTVEAARGRNMEDWTRERDQIASRLRELEEANGQARAALDADSLRTYDHLRKTKAGRAVASLRRDACSACGVAVPTGHAQRLRTGDEIIFCSGCGRILVP